MGSLPLLLKSFALAFSALLPVVNPLGSALVFLGLVGHQPASAFRDLARKIAISMTLFLVIVEMVGTGLLQFFGISLPVVQISGGLVLASMGWSLLNKPDTETAPSSTDIKKVGSDGLEQNVFYPLTFPVTVGPGCIVVMLTLTAHVVKGTVLQDIAGHVGILMAVVALSLTVYWCYRYAPKITAHISPSTAHGILGIVAFVLLCIGVQITSRGLETLIREVLKH